MVLAHPIKLTPQEQCLADEKGQENQERKKLETNFYQLEFVELSLWTKEAVLPAAIALLLPKLNNEIIILVLLRSIVGAAIIVTGFYGVIWAQSDKEQVGKTTTTPLLEGHDVDA
ncbi:WAT1-related protein [Gossypium australe]|uniref:WAT1-related protein n=1 Tax=Gossypium australe TaxID=47621 RepID=A0A5B6UCB5_9ROSI|nr:WAT1-related protein [Gossypium australe]